MKLRPRQEVQSLRENERRAEIEEGMDLANRITELRRLRLEEEKSLLEYRETVISSVTAEIEALKTEKAAIGSEISSARSLREDLLKPLDSEWDRLRIEESRLLLAAEKMGELAEENRIAAEGIERLGKGLGIREGGILQRERELDKLVEATTRLKEDAAAEYRASLSLREEAEGVRRAAQSEIGLLIATYENGIAVNEMDSGRIRETESELISREAVLRDREETLERELRRKHQ